MLIRYKTIVNKEVDYKTTKPNIKKIVYMLLTADMG